MTYEIVRQGGRGGRGLYGTGLFFVYVFVCDCASIISIFAGTDGTNVSLGVWFETHHAVSTSVKVSWSPLV